MFRPKLAPSNPASKCTCSSHGELVSLAHKGLNIGFPLSPAELGPPLGAVVPRPPSGVPPEQSGHLSTLSVSRPSLAGRAQLTAVASITFDSPARKEDSINNPSLSLLLSHVVLIPVSLGVPASAASHSLPGGHSCPLFLRQGLVSDRAYLGWALEGKWSTTVRDRF